MVLLLHGHLEVVAEAEAEAGEVTPMGDAGMAVDGVLRFSKEHAPN